jgi:hypothetical protein
VRIDWQAYLDGSLTESERAAAEHELQTNPYALRELQGLERFISSVKSHALAENVPIRRLEAMMPKAESRPALRRLQLVGWTAGLAAAATIAAAILLNSGQSEVWELITDDPAVASKWASAKLDAEVPRMDLGPDAKLMYVHEGAEKCCFDYRVGGEVYHVNLGRRPNELNLRGRAIKLATGETAFVDGGIRWTQAGYSLYVVGPNDAVSQRLADRTSAVLFQGA